MKNSCRVWDGGGAAGSGNASSAFVRRLVKVVELTTLQAARVRFRSGEKRVLYPSRFFAFNRRNSSNRSAIRFSIPRSVGK